MEKNSRVFTIINLIMFAAYVMSVAVQYNDPDPMVWMLMYGLAAAACFLAHQNRLKWWLSAQIAAIALLWAAVLTPKFWGSVSFFELFEAFEMKSVPVEQAREMGGLMIIAVWMIFLTWHTYRRA